MATVELERTLVKSPPELWDEIARDAGLSRWLGEVRVSAAEPPRRLEWNGSGASGVIELEPSGWGTKVRALATTNERLLERFRGEPISDRIERGLNDLLEDLGSSSLTSS
jgi:hypothetical protein